MEPRDVLTPEPVTFSAPETAPPEQATLAIVLEKADRDTLAIAYGNEIVRALDARQGVRSREQWQSNDAGTTATIVGTRTGSTKGFEEEIQDYWDRYELVPPARDLPFDGAANYRVPLTKWAVDSIHGRIMAGITGIRPYFQIEPRQPEDVQKASRVEEFLDYVMEQEINFKEWLDDALLNAEVEGTAIGYLIWEERKEHRFAEVVEDVQVPLFDTEGIAGTIGAPLGIKNTQHSRIEEREDVVSAGPRLYLVPLTDFLVADPRRKDLSEQPWMGHRVRLYRHELAQLAGQEGYFDEEIAEVLQGAGYGTADGRIDVQEQGLENRTGIDLRDQHSTMRMNDWFEVWPLLVWYDWDGDGKPERCVAEIAMPQKKLIRLIKYGYLHNRPNYIPLRPLPRSNFFYGRSLVGDLRMTQDEIDAIHNQRTDATSIAIASLFMFLYDEQAGFDPARTKIALGESIRVDGDINHIQVLAKSFRGIAVPGADVEQMLLGFAERLSGISDPQTGRPSGGRPTAFEIGAVIQEGNVRFRRMIERVELPLSEFANQVIGLYQQYANPVEPLVYAVLNDQDNPFRTTEVGELAGRYNYRVHGVGVASNQDIDARKAMDMLSVVGQSQLIGQFIAASPVRSWKFAKTIFDKIGWQGSEEFLGKLEEIMNPPVPPAPPGAGTDPKVEKFVEENLAQGGGEGGTESAGGTPGPGIAPRVAALAPGGGGPQG